MKPRVSGPLEQRYRVDANGCWLWLGHVGAGGYARITVDGTRYMAHRYTYELYVGPIPEGLQLDHLCRVRNCINPAHLEPVTAKENLRRGTGPGTKTHCPQGHPYAGDNLKTYEKYPFRWCLTCKRTNDRRNQAKYRARRREAQS